VLPAVLLTGMLALAAAAGAAVMGEDPCVVASPSASAEPTISPSADPSASAEPSVSASPEPSADPTESASAEPTTIASLEPTVAPSAEPSTVTPTESAPVAADPAPASADETAPAVDTRAKDLTAPVEPAPVESTPEEPAPAEPAPADPSALADPCAEPEAAALLSAGPPVLVVVPDGHDLMYLDAVPEYSFTLLDASVTPAVPVDPETLSPLVLDPGVLTTYVPPVCSTDHEVVVPPVDAFADETKAIERYQDGVSVDPVSTVVEPATSVAESPLAVTCTEGVLEGYTFDVTAIAELTIAKLVTEVVSPPTAAPISYGQTLHDSTLTGGGAKVVGGGAAPGYFSFPLDSWSVTPLVGTQNHVVAFVPEDFANYEPSATTIDVTVGKATPVIVTPPTASGLVTGQTLAGSTLTGGVASTEGTFAFTSPGTAPADGASAQRVTFTPTDQANFATSPATTVDIDVTVTAPPLDYATAGYLGRVGMGTVTNLVRPRVMVPLPFTVTGGGAAAGDVKLVKSFDPVAISCEALVDNTTEVFPSVALGRSSRLVYDSADSRFVQFWKVPVTRNTCYRVTTTIADGDTIVAYFRTR